MSKKREWKKCYKVNCTPPLEVFEDFVRVYGENIDIVDLPKYLKRQQEKLETYKEVLRVWEKHFGIRNNK